MGRMKDPFLRKPQEPHSTDPLQVDMFPTGAELLEEGTRRALDNEDPIWVLDALGVLYALARDNEFLTADDLRTACTMKGVRRPHHPNCWGALFRTARKANMIVKTGKALSSERPEAHRRLVPQWKSKIYERY